MEPPNGFLKEHAPNYVGTSKYDLRYLPKFRGIGLSKFRQVLLPPSKSEALSLSLVW